MKRETSMQPLIREENAAFRDGAAGRLTYLRDWGARLEKLAVQCAMPGPGAQDMADLLLMAEALVLGCPLQLSRWSKPASHATVRAHRLEAGAFVDFALGLCSKPMTYMLTHGCDGHALATIALPSLQQEQTCEAAELPLAILEALARLLAQVAQMHAGATGRLGATEHRGALAYTGVAQGLLH